MEDCSHLASHLIPPQLFPLSTSFLPLLLSFLSLCLSFFVLSFPPLPPCLLTFFFLLSYSLYFQLLIRHEPFPHPHDGVSPAVTLLGWNNHSRSSHPIRSLCGGEDGLSLLVLCFSKRDGKPNAPKWTLISILGETLQTRVPRWLAPPAPPALIEIGVTWQSNLHRGKNTLPGGWFWRSHFEKQFVCTWCTGCLFWHLCKYFFLNKGQLSFRHTESSHVITQQTAPETLGAFETQALMLVLYWTQKRSWKMCLTPTLLCAKPRK